MANKIYVGNLPSSLTEKELFELFSPLGEVISARIILNMDGKTTAGYGYVTMTNEKDVQTAVQKLNNTIVMKKNIRVVKAHPIDQDSSYLAKKNKYLRFNRFRR